MRCPIDSSRCLVVFLSLVAGPTAGSTAEDTTAEDTPGDGRIRVAVYSGEGAGRGRTSLVDLLERSSRAARFDVVRIDGPAIREGGLDGIDVLVHPGGSGSKQAKALGKKGREVVRQFVSGGGGYIGICAGGYLATNDYDWSLGLIDAKVTDRRHWARGTGTVKIELSPAAQRFFESEREVDIYYGQGPLLARREWDDERVPDYESLAVYRTGIAKNGAPAGVMPGTSAIVRTRYGDGRVFVFSAHPEKTESLGGMVLKAVRWAAE